MFSKIDKKILVIALIFFVVVLLIGIIIYKNLKSGSNIENSLGGANTQAPAGNEQNNNPQNNQAQIQTEIKAEPQNNTNSIGTFTICVDECGNGVCQEYDPNCEVEGLNCICSETPKDCPQDCK